MATPWDMYEIDKLYTHVSANNLPFQGAIYLVFDLPQGVAIGLN